MAIVPGELLVRNVDGEAVLDGIFPKYVLFSNPLLDHLDPKLGWKDGKLVFLRLSNAEAVYECLWERWRGGVLYKLQRLEI